MTGRRFLLLGLLFSTLPAAAQAQFGLRGGINLTKFVGGDAADVEASKGINLGGSKMKFEVNPEVSDKPCRSL